MKVRNIFSALFMSLIVMVSCQQLPDRNHDELRAPKVLNVDVDSYDIGWEGGKRPKEGARATLCQTKRDAKHEPQVAAKSRVPLSSDRQLPVPSALDARAFTLQYIRGRKPPVMVFLLYTETGILSRCVPDKIP